MHVDIVLAPGLNHFFRELIDALVVELEPLVRRVSISVGGPSPADVDTIWLVCPPHEIASLGQGWMLADPLIAARTIGITAEQPGTSWFDDNVPWLRALGAVFDISPLGAAALRDRGFDAHVLPLGGGRSTSARRSAERPIDIVVLWSETDRRTRIAAQLLSRLDGLRITGLRASAGAPLRAPGLDYIGGRSRHELLARSKVQLNIHRGDVPYFEWLRCLAAMEAGARFVSETGAGCEPLVAGEHFDVFAQPLTDVGAVDWDRLADDLRSTCRDEALLTERRAASAEWLDAHPLRAAAEALVGAGSGMLTAPLPAQFVDEAVPSWSVRDHRRQQARRHQTRTPMVELWGTFDVDNLGDQLFPVVLAHSLTRRLPPAVVSLATPLGGPVAGWTGEHDGPFAPPALTTRRIATFTEPGSFEQSALTDAVIVAGGDVIHGDSPVLRLGNGTAVRYPFDRIPLASAMLGSRVRVAWHAVGIPVPITGELDARLSAVIANVESVTVREPTSLGHLSQVGGRGALVLDPVWALPDVWPRSAVSERGAELVRASALPRGRYVCVHQSFLDDESLDSVRDGIVELRRDGIEVVIVSLAPCLDEDRTAGDLAAATGATAFVAHTVPDRVAALAGSAAYVGSSLHGGVVAAAYGVPVMWMRDVPKVRGAAAVLGDGRLIEPRDLASGVRRLLAGELAVDEAATSAARDRASADIDQLLDRLVGGAPVRRPTRAAAEVA